MLSSLKSCLCFFSSFGMAVLFTDWRLFITYVSLANSSLGGWILVGTYPLHLASFFVVGVIAVIAVIGGETCA